MMIADLPLQLNSCDQEKIHLAGAIQDHGCLIAYDPVTSKILVASENVGTYLMTASPQVVGAKLRDIFSSDNFQKIRSNAGNFETLRANEIYFEMTLLTPSQKSVTYEALMYEEEKLIVVEFERTDILGQARAQSQLDLAVETKKLSQELYEQKDIVSGAKLLCRSVRHVIDFERVMLYRFLPNWDGEVIAEDKTSEAHSFLRHRFPATDIPAPARELYLQNRTRLIYDAAAPRIPLIPRPIDLSKSKLRAVSPVHIEYLKNMMVRCSYSIAIIDGGKLWGLIACHGGRPVQIPHALRLATETMASMFAGFAALLDQSKNQKAEIEFQRRRFQLFSEIGVSSDLVGDLFKKYEFVCQMFDAKGLASVQGKALNVDLAGLTPPVASIQKLSTWIRARLVKSRESIFETASLASLDSQWESIGEFASGVLAMKLADLPSDDGGPRMVLFFRPEIRAEITWGGDPRKNLEGRNYEGPINPRKSFETWTSIVTHNAQPWQKYEVEGIASLEI